MNEVPHGDRFPGRPSTARGPEAASGMLDPETLSQVESFSERRKSEALSIDDPHFASVSDEQKAKHLHEIIRLEGKFETAGATGEKKETHLISEAFEYVISERINNGDWLGPDVKAQLTCAYDDYLNGIDLYLEDTQHAAGRPLGVSIDVTFSNDRRPIRAKIENIKTKLLDGGRLAHMSYYKPLSENDQMGTTSAFSLPKVIVGVDRAEAIAAIQNLALKEEDGKGEKDWKTGLTVLVQITEQLKTYRTYSATRIDANVKPWVTETIARYDEMIADMDRLMNELFATKGLDADKVRAFAKTSTVTQAILAELELQLQTSA